MTSEQRQLRDSLNKILKYLAQRDETDCDVREWAKDFLTLGAIMRSLGVAESWRQATLPMETDRSVLQALWLAANVTGEEDKRRFTSLVDVLRGVMDSPAALRIRFRESLISLLDGIARPTPFSATAGTSYFECAN